MLPVTADEMLANNACSREYTYIVALLLAYKHEHTIHDILFNAMISRPSLGLPYTCYQCDKKARLLLIYHHYSMYIYATVMLIG